MILLRYNVFSTGGELILKFYDYPIISKESSLPVFLVSVGLNEWQYHVKCDKGDNYAKALYCTKGSGVLIINGEKHIIKPYTEFFIPAGCPHEYYSTDESWDTHWIKPSGKSCPDMLKALGFDKPKIFPLPKEEITYLDCCFRCMHEALLSDKVDGYFRASGYLYSFFIELSRLAAQYSDVNCTPEDIKLYLERIARGTPVASRAASMSTNDIEQYLQSMREQKQGTADAEDSV